MSSTAPTTSPPSCCRLQAPRRTWQDQPARADDRDERADEDTPEDAMADHRSDTPLGAAEAIVHDSLDDATQAALVDSYIAGVSA